MEKLQIIDSTTITLFSNLIFKDAGRNPKSGKKKGGIKVHKVIRALEGVLQVFEFILSIARKAWWKLGGIMAGGFLCALGFAAIVFVGMVTVLFEEEEDHFGMEHPIPDTLQCKVPIGGVIMPLPEDSCSVAAGSDSIRILSTDKSTWLQLYEGGQPGIYEYTLYAPALPDGYVYLRCFEVMKDIALSTKEIVKRTKHEFSDHRDYYTCAA